jgi:hypothetical protein
MAHAVHYPSSPSPHDGEEEPMKRLETIARAQHVLDGGELASIDGGGLPLYYEPVRYRDSGTSVRQVDTPRGERPVMYADRGSTTRDSGSHHTHGQSRGSQADLPRRHQNSWDEPGPAWR